MKVSYILNIETSKFDGFLFFDNTKMFFYSLDEELNECLKFIINNDLLFLQIKDKVNYHTLMKHNDEYYINVLNDYIPMPWRINHTVYLENSNVDMILKKFNEGDFCETSDSQHS